MPENKSWELKQFNKIKKAGEKELPSVGYGIGQIDPGLMSALQAKQNAALGTIPKSFSKPDVGAKDVNGKSNSGQSNAPSGSCVASALNQNKIAPAAETLPGDEALPAGGSGGGGADSGQAAAAVDQLSQAAGGDSTAELAANGFPAGTVTSQPGRVIQKQDKVALVRKGTIGSELTATLNQGLARSGIPGLNFVVESGAQPNKGTSSPRIGSIRHDHGSGSAADGYFELNGRKLSGANPADRQILKQAVGGMVGAGIRGVGWGPDYMGNSNFHLDLQGTNPGGRGGLIVWGEDGLSANAHSWVVEATATLPSGATKGNIQRAQQIAGVANSKINVLGAQAAAASAAIKFNPSNELTKAITALPTQLSQGLPQLSELAGAFGNIAPQLGKVSQLMGSVSQLATLPGQITNSLTALSNLPGQISNVFAGGIPNLQTAFGQLPNLIGNLQGVLPGAIGQLSNALPGLVGNLQGALPGLAGEAAGMLNEAASKFGDIGSSLAGGAIDPANLPQMENLAAQVPQFNRAVANCTNPRVRSGSGSGCTAVAVSVAGAAASMSQGKGVAPPAAFDSVMNKLTTENPIGALGEQARAAADAAMGQIPAVGIAGLANPLQEITKNANAVVNSIGANILPGISGALTGDVAQALGKAAGLVGTIKNFNGNILQAGQAMLGSFPGVFNTISGLTGNTGTLKNLINTASGLAYGAAAVKDVLKNGLNVNSMLALAGNIEGIEGLDAVANKLAYNLSNKVNLLAPLRETLGVAVVAKDVINGFSSIFDRPSTVATQGFGAIASNISLLGNDLAKLGRFGDLDDLFNIGEPTQVLRQLVEVGVADVASGIPQKIYDRNINLGDIMSQSQDDEILGMLDEITDPEVITKTKKIFRIDPSVNIKSLGDLTRPEVILPTSYSKCNFKKLQDIAPTVMLNGGTGELKTLGDLGSFLQTIETIEDSNDLNQQTTVVTVEELDQLTSTIPAEGKYNDNGVCMADFVGSLAGYGHEKTFPVMDQLLKKIDSSGITANYKLLTELLTETLQNEYLKSSIQGNPVRVVTLFGYYYDGTPIHPIDLTNLYIDDGFGNTILNPAYNENDFLPSNFNNPGGIYVPWKRALNYIPIQNFYNQESVNWVHNGIEYTFFFDAYENLDSASIALANTTNKELETVKEAKYFNDITKIHAYILDIMFENWLSTRNTYDEKYTERDLLIDQRNNIQQTISNLTTTIAAIIGAGGDASAEQTQKAAAEIALADTIAQIESLTNELVSLAESMINMQPNIIHYLPIPFVKIDELREFIDDPLERLVQYFDIYDTLKANTENYKNILFQNSSSNIIGNNLNDISDGFGLENMLYGKEANLYNVSTYTSPSGYIFGDPLNVQPESTDPLEIVEINNNSKYPDEVANFAYFVGNVYESLSHELKDYVFITSAPYEDNWPIEDTQLFFDIEELDVLHTESSNQLAHEQMMREKFNCDIGEPNVEESYYGDGSQTSFKLEQKFAENVQVFVNGLRKKKDIHFSLSTDEFNFVTVTMSSPPGARQMIDFVYNVPKNLPKTSPKDLWDFAEKLETISTKTGYGNPAEFFDRMITNDADGQRIRSVMVQARNKKRFEEIGIRCPGWNRVSEDPEQTTDFNFVEKTGIWSEDPKRAGLIWLQQNQAVDTTQNYIAEKIKRNKDSVTPIVDDVMLKIISQLIFLKDEEITMSAKFISLYDTYKDTYTNLEDESVFWLDVEAEPASAGFTLGYYRTILSAIFRAESIRTQIFNFPLTDTSKKYLASINIDIVTLVGLIQKIMLVNIGRMLSINSDDVQNIFNYPSIGKLLLRNIADRYDVDTPKLNLFNEVGPLNSSDDVAAEKGIVDDNVDAFGDLFSNNIPSSSADNIPSTVGKISTVGSNINPVPDNIVDEELESNYNYNTPNVPIEKNNLSLTENEPESIQNIPSSNITTKDKAPAFSRIVIEEEVKVNYPDTSRNNKNKDT